MSEVAMHTIRENMKTLSRVDKTIIFHELANLIEEDLDKEMESLRDQLSPMGKEMLKVFLTAFKPKSDE